MLSYRGVELESEGPVYRHEETLWAEGPRAIVQFTGPSHGEIAMSRASPTHCPDGDSLDAALTGHLLDHSRESRVGPANFAPHLRLAANPLQPDSGRPAFWPRLGELREERPAWG